ncbi:uncharacterized protein LOC102804103 [Saccoglossus kowalevskii]|uniref:Uncharacterized protein LOC102804103 n=1 Tax=Saccoglossus kowalevskii TaxID=10224 RepID=A0ABM0MPZ5_SACKO|nr:PREDICTED: uncharacterized protein LOC102804103 [Saccoglossus kowalevskii]
MEGLVYKSIKVYLAAIVSLNAETGHTEDIASNNMLRHVLQGIKHDHGNPIRPRLPITMTLMRKIKNALRSHPAIHVNDKLMLWSAFTLAFFGFLRVSEFTATSASTFDNDGTLLGSDVLLTDDLIVTIKASKTDPFRRGQVVTIAPTQSSICAVRAFRNYNPAALNAPAFCFTNGKFLTRQAVTYHLRDLLLRAEVPNVSNYTSHSFRSGAATTAAEANLPDWLIKVLGRWRSDAYQLYITTPTDIIRKVPATLAQHR